MSADLPASFTGAQLRLVAVSDAAVRAIPPLWPLAATVAVNPFLGQTGQSLGQVGALLGRVAGTPVTMPRAWFAARLEDGMIEAADLDAALAAAPAGAPAPLAGDVAGGHRLVHGPQEHTTGRRNGYTCRLPAPVGSEAALRRG